MAPSMSCLTIHYQSNPIKTAKTSFRNLQYARLAKTKARILLASTSEVYGDPEIHPQNEEYKGCVNPIGIKVVMTKVRELQNP